VDAINAAIAACLAVHAEAIEVAGSAYPERDPRIPAELRAKVERQRRRVEQTLEHAAHPRHVESLTQGVRICLRRLAPSRPRAAKPPAPTWDEATKRWIVR
jgi:hypothetical protein